MSVKKQITKIKTEIHWNALESLLQDFARKKATKDGHSNPTNKANSFKYGALLCDDVRDFKIREVPVSSNFADSKPTAMITTAQLFDYLIDEQYSLSHHSVNVSNNNTATNIVWVMDMLWSLIESKKSKGIMYIGGDLKPIKNTNYYSNFKPEHLISKRYTSLYPSKKWLRERNEAGAKGYEGISEDLAKEYDEFCPINPMAIMCDILYPHDYEVIKAMPKYKRRKNLPAPREWQNRHINFCTKTEMLKLRNKMEELCLIG